MLGRYFEAKAKGRTSQAIQHLVGMQPKTARIQRDGQVVEVAEQTTNIVKVKKLKLPATKKQKEKILKRSKNQKLAESLEQKKARCDKKRDELRFQAFRYDERNQYDHECVSEVKW